MRRIGITQRVEVVEDYEERRDCLDQRWGPLLRSMGLLPIPLCNRIDDVAGYVSALDLDGFLLTGGNDIAGVEDASNVAPERDAFEDAVLDFAASESIPVLGVCRGAQLVNVHFGGSLSTVEGHVDREHEVSIADAPVTDAPTQVTTNSYHGYGVTPDGVADSLRVAGRCRDGTVEWLYHDERPVSAIMWHPERESPSAALDRRIIQQSLGNGSR